MRVKFFLFVLMIMLTPLYVISIYMIYDKALALFEQYENRYKRYEEKNIEKFKINNFIRVYDNNIDSIIKLDIEEYVLSAVAAEMPISFEYEALCAQAVASRSFAVSKMIANREASYDVTLDYHYDQAYVKTDKLKEKWNENYEQNMLKLKSVIENTRGEIVTYKGEIANTYFHSTSSGMTQESGDVWVRNYPYLKPVKSDESLSPKKESEVIVSYGNIIEKIKENNKESNDEIVKISNIKITKKNKSGYVKEVIINDKTYSGMDIRNMFGLNSNAFEILNNIENEEITFKVKGFGHGIGMSQYGANKLAKDGYDYTRILKHYYSDVKIEKVIDVCEIEV